MAAKKGRPCAYTKAQADKICRRLADGESLNKICKDKNTPCKQTVLNWLQSSNRGAFLDQYRRACDAGWKARADLLYDLPDETVKTYIDEGGNQRIDSGSVQLVNVKSRNLIWLLSKHMRGIYGDPQEVEKPKEEEKPHSATVRNIISEPKPKRQRLDE